MQKRRKNTVCFHTVCSLDLTSGTTLPIETQGYLNWNCITLEESRAYPTFLSVFQYKRPLLCVGQIRWTESVDYVMATRVRLQRQRYAAVTWGTLLQRPVTCLNFPLGFQRSCSLKSWFEKVKKNCARILVFRRAAVNTGNPGLTHLFVFVPNLTSWPVF